MNETFSISKLEIDALALLRQTLVLEPELDSMYETADKRHDRVQMSSECGYANCMGSCAGTCIGSCYGTCVGGSML